LSHFSPSNICRLETFFIYFGSPFYLFRISILFISDLHFIYFGVAKKYGKMDIDKTLLQYSPPIYLWADEKKYGKWNN